MDDKNQQPQAQSEQQASPPASVTRSTATPTTSTTPQSTDKPAMNMADFDVQSYLELQGVGSKPQKEVKLPIGVIISIVTVVLLAVVASFMLSSTKSSPSSTGTNGATTTSNEPTPQSGNQEINQDVKSCSNVVNALTQC